MRTLTLNMPGPLYDQLKDRAERSNRTVEDETIDLLAALVPVADELSEDLLNRASLVMTRRLWASVGWHPPRD